MEERYFESQLFENLMLSGECFKNCAFIDCRFHNCRFENSKLIQCSFTGCTFEKCVIAGLKATQSSQIQDTEFENCSLIGINWNELLPSKKFADPISKLKACQLKYNSFTDMNFKKFNFSENEITESMFGECQLAESRFKNCNLEKTEFFKCDIRKADFRDATGYQIDVLSNQLAGAGFSFPEVINLLNGLGIKID